MQGESVDVGGYYRPDDDKARPVMRPSKTFNEALAPWLTHTSPAARTVDT